MLHVRECELVPHLTSKRVVDTLIDTLYDVDKCVNVLERIQSYYNHGAIPKTVWHYIVKSMSERMSTLLV